MSSQPDPGDRRRLERPPGERYNVEAADRAPAPEADGRRSRAGAIAGSLGVGLAGAAVIALLGNVGDIVAGLLVAAALVGWLVAAVLRTAGESLPRASRTGLALAIAIGAVALGQAGLWLLARLEGGVLDPVAYLGELFGLLSPLMLLAAAAAAWWTAR